jgi:hypothetical protein
MSTNTQESIVTLHTDGKGLWSNAKQAVRIIDFELSYIDTKEEFGELRVLFDERDWTVDALGLIYTDRLFLQELSEYLNSIGLAGDDVDYSEQGMQGENFVSCDVGKKFIKSYKEKFADKYAEAYEFCNGCVAGQQPQYAEIDYFYGS